MAICASSVSKWSTTTVVSRTISFREQRHKHRAAMEPQNRNPEAFARMKLRGGNEGAANHRGPGNTDSMGS
jgi:hypothetical protein